jgi:hypothetical protein
MKIWQRLLIAITSVAALYALWRFPPAGIDTVLIGACAAWLGRGIYRSKLAANPMGENRDYSLRPVGRTVAKAVGSFAAAMIWAVFMAYAIRRNYVPDTWLGAAVVFGPGLVLLAISVIYLGKAMARFQLGGKPPTGRSR